MLLFPVVGSFLNDSPEIFTPSSTPAQQITIKKISSFSTFGSCGMYTDPKHSQTVPRLISTLSPSFTLTLSRAIIPFRFPLQSGPRGLSGLVHMHCMDTGWEPFACSYSIPRACSTDPEYYATRTSLAVMAKLSLSSWKNTLTDTLARGYVPHKETCIWALCEQPVHTE